jgi:hypothetical protein
VGFETAIVHVVSINSTVCLSVDGEVKGKALPEETKPLSLVRLRFGCRNAHDTNNDELVRPPSFALMGVLFTNRRRATAFRALARLT